MKKIWTKTVFQYNKKNGNFELDKAASHYELMPEKAPIMRMKGASNQGGNTTTVQKTDPWIGQQPYLERGFDQIKKEFLDVPPTAYYPGSSVAPFSQDTLNAQNMIRSNAGNISSLQDPTMGLLNRTINGDYLYGGEGFNKALTAANNTITPMVNSTFERSGRGGSGLADVAKTSALGDIFAKQYAGERENQMRAGQMAPLVAGTFQNLNNQNVDRLAGIGNQQEQLTQQQLEEKKNAYDYNSNARRNAVLQYMNAIQGNYGGSSSGTTSTPGAGGMNNFMRFLTSGAGGALQGGAMGGWPGAAIGGGLGLLQAWQ